MKRIFLLAGYLILLFQIACVRHQTHPARHAAPLVKHPDYVDVQARWTIRVVIPILKSGGFILPSLASQESGSTDVNGDDFIGYEKVVYKVERSNKKRLRVRMTRCEEWRNRKKTNCSVPTVDLFKQIRDVGQIRMVYLTRISRADHDVVLVAGNNLEALETVTAGVTDRGKCEEASEAICTTVPRGISVNPEDGKQD